MTLTFDLENQYSKLHLNKQGYNKILLVTKSNESPGRSPNTLH